VAHGLKVVKIVPLTNDRWDDLVDLFGPRGADAGCWCMYFRVSSRDWSWTGAAQNRHAREALAGSEPAPGLLAYLAGQAVGWVGLGPRSSFERLNRSRKYPPLDELRVWSVVCFFVRRTARARGVADALLAGAIAYAREHGADGLEGYAVEPAERMPPADAYHGTVAMFERAGFRRARQATSPGGRHDRWIMRLEFGGARR
jgi:GNAT superfamily N-acetyltransferase